METTAALGDDGVELGERGEVPIDDGLVDQRPEALGGLQLRTVGRQEDEPDAVRHGEPGLGVPAGIVEHQDDDALASGAALAREGGEQRLEEPLIDAGRQIPDGLPACRLDEGGDVEPFIAMVAKRRGARPDGGPDPAPDGLQAETVLVLRPDLDRPIGMRRLGLRDGFLEPLLKSARCSGVAALGCRRRGA